MSKVPVSLLGGPGPTSGRDVLGGLSPEQQSEIGQLFEAALAGTLPRKRELKPWEPQTLNERHVTMIMMRAAGLRQRQIAEMLGATDSNVSVVLNHPDSEFLLARLQAAKFSAPTDIERRMEALKEQAMESLEEFFDPAADVPVVRRAPLAFKLLEADRPKKKTVEHDHRHRLEADPAQMAQLTKAIRESREIRDVKYVDVTDEEDARRMLSKPPGGDGSAVPSGPGAPSIGGSQEAEDV